MKKIVLTIAAAAILVACAAHHSNGGNELYGEIKGGVSVGHTHTRYAHACRAAKQTARYEASASE